MTLFAADGSLNVTVVDGNSYTGAQAADGSLNVLVVDGTDYTGLLAGCGAVNVIAAVADSNSYFHPCGAWYISESPYYTGAVKVTVMSGSIGGSSLTAPVLTWDGETLDLTPDFAIDLTAPAVSDIITMRRSTDSGFATYDDATETVSSIGPVVLSGAFDFGGDWTPGTWYVKVSVTRGVDTSAFSNIETLSLTSIAPVLSLPTDTSTGTTTASGTVSTTGTDGTLYAVVTTSGTSPTAAQVKAGQDHTGAAAVDTASQAVSGSGVQTITGGFTGLTASTAYYAHYMHEDAAAQQSNVSSADGFTTDPAANPSVYVGHHSRDAAAATTSTHSVDFGTINFQKTAVIVVNLFSTGAGDIITGVAVDSNPTTQVVQHNQGFSHTAIFRIDVTSGGTKSIVVTTSALMYNIDVAVHILTDMNPVPTATDKHQYTWGTTRTLFNGSSGNGTGTQSLPSGGVMILSCASEYNNAITFPAATTDSDTFTGSAGTIRSSTGHHYGSDIDPVTTIAAATEFSTAGAMWGP